MADIDNGSVYDEDQLTALTEAVGTLTAQIQGLHAPLRQIDAIARGQQDLKVLLNQVLENLQTNPASAIVSSGAAPPLTRPFSAVGKPDINPFSLEISIRPYKVMTSSLTGFTLNTSPVYKTLLQLVCFESQWPGSADAVIGILQSCMLGMPADLAPIDWDAVNKNSVTTGVVQYVANQKLALTNLFTLLTKPDFNMADPANAPVVKNIQTQLGKIIGGTNMPGLADAKAGLANLFQATGTPFGSVYGRSQQRTSTKTFLSQTYLGIAWNLRLPRATRDQIVFTIPEKINVPPIEFAQTTPRAPYATSFGSGTIGHPVDDAI